MGTDTDPLDPPDHDDALPRLEADDRSGPRSRFVDRLVAAIGTSARTRVRPALDGPDISSMAETSPAATDSEPATPWWRRRLVVGGLALAAIAATVLTVVIVRRVTTPDPGAVVLTYLHDLAAGDAEGALAQGADRPASAQFLTDAILKRQQRSAAIGNIHIVRVDTDDDMATVTATYTFGKQYVRAPFTATESHGQWRLDHTVVKVTRFSTYVGGQLVVGSGATLFGRPVHASEEISAFPGPLEFGTTNPNLTLTDSTPDRFTTAPEYDATTPGESPNDVLQGPLTTAITAAGKRAAAQAFARFYAKCTPEHTDFDDGCPIALEDYEHDSSDTTSQWTIPTDYSRIEFDPTSTPDQMSFHGRLSWPITGAHLDNDPANTTSNVDLQPFVKGTIDLTATPPVVKESW